jgi:hypothetical protein
VLVFNVQWPEAEVGSVSCMPQVLMRVVDLGRSRRLIDKHMQYESILYNSCPACKQLVIYIYLVLIKNSIIAMRASCISFCSKISIVGYIFPSHCRDEGCCNKVLWSFRSIIHEAGLNGGLRTGP